MSEKEYITVKEYATAKGITIQAVYKRLNKGLKPYLIMVEGQKCLKIEVLNSVELEKLNSVDKLSTQLSTDSTQPIQPPESEILKNQLAEKDKQIESLLRQLEEIQSQNKKLTEQHDEFIKLISQSQYITATEQQRLIEEKPKEETKKKSIFGIFKKKH